MITAEKLQQLRDLLPQAQRIAILIGKQPSDDALASAASLALSLREMGKEVIVAGPTPLTKKSEYLEGLDGYTSSLGNQNLVVSFDYVESAVENVSYHIGQESSKFFLTIKPQKGHKPLDASSVQFSYAGADADLIVLVGVSSLESLDDIYVANEQFFADTTAISLNTYETEVGQIKLDTSGESSMSAAVASLLRQLELPVPAAAATNLLAGIEQTTSNFKSLSTTPETLETAAWLMRLGARRVWRESRAGGQSAIEAGGQTVGQAGQSNESQAFAQVFGKQHKNNGEPRKKDKKDKKPQQGSETGGLNYQPGSVSKV